MKKWQKMAIEEIMENFDFRKVHKTMILMNWTWRDGGVPSVEDLKLTAKDCLNEGINGAFGSGTGGFYVYCHPKSKLISLQFCVEVWENSL